MKTELVLEKINDIMNELSIMDDDIRQEIYLKALTDIDKCDTDDNIIINIINPIVLKNLNELMFIKRNFYPIKSLDKLNKDNSVSEKIKNDNNKHKLIEKIHNSPKCNLVYAYIIDEYFLNETELDIMASRLNVPIDVMKSIIEFIINDIKSSF